MCVDVPKYVLLDSLTLHKFQYNVIYGRESQLLLELTENNSYIASTHELDACNTLGKSEEHTHIDANFCSNIYVGEKHSGVYIVIPYVCVYQVTFYGCTCTKPTRPDFQ